MTSTAFQEGPHFQDIWIYKVAYNLYKKYKIGKYYTCIYSFNCLSDISFSSERIDVGTLFHGYLALCHPFHWGLVFRNLMSSRNSRNWIPCEIKVVVHYTLTWFAWIQFLSGITVIFFKPCIQSTVQHNERKMTES